MSKQSSIFSLPLASALLLSPLVAMAAPSSITANFTGNGQLCRLDSSASSPDWICAAGYTISGQMTLAVVGEADSKDSNEANGESWISASLMANWSGPVTGGNTEHGIFSVSSKDAGATVTTTATVRNDQVTLGTNLYTDALTTQTSSLLVDSTQMSIKQFELDRYVRHSVVAPEWLSSLAFDLTGGLAPTQDYSEGANTLVINALSGTVDNSVPTIDYAATYQGRFELTNFNVSAVPEPDSWALLAAGCTLLWMRRRQRPTKPAARN